MKKTFIVLGLSLVIAACGGGKSSSGSADSTNAANKTAEATNSNADTAASHNGTEKAAGTPSAAGAQLIAKSDCGTCHKEQVKLIGPAFVDVAKKYTSADVDSLADKIVKGGSGHWGTVPMAPHPTISVGDAKSMVEYILSLKK
jgi:cytochrome c